MSKHTPTPWRTDESEHEATIKVIALAGDYSRIVARIGLADAPHAKYNAQQRANARHIVNAVNYHDRLREALISCAEQLDDDDPDSRCMDNIVSDKAHKLLAELDNLEKQP
jgi:hypothetical protein